MKVEHFHSKLKSHITKQLLTTISVDIRIYLPEKVIIYRGRYLIEVNNCIIIYCKKVRSNNIDRFLEFIRPIRCRVAYPPGASVGNPYICISTLCKTCRADDGPLLGC